MLLTARFITALFCLFTALPIVWLVYAAFLPQEAVMFLDLTHFGFSLENFKVAWGSGIFRALAISLLASGLTVLGQLIFGVMMAYSLWRGLPLFLPILFALALPAELLLVPLYGLLHAFGWLETFQALVIPFLASPLVIFLLRQAMQRIPNELSEAARLDGANDWHILWRIIVPLVRPELAAAGILGFAAHWNLVLYPKVVADVDSLRTVQIFLNDLLANDKLNWGLLGAASLLATLPLLILYIIFEGRILKTFEASFK